MNRLYYGGLVLLVLGVAIGTLAVVRSFTPVETCGFGVVDWGGGEGPTDTEAVAKCPGERSGRKNEVVVEGVAAVVLLTAGTTLTVLGKRKDRRDAAGLPRDPFEDQVPASP